jgi:DNA (cytosine-5)-methyltransferase 1
MIDDHVARRTPRDYETFRRMKHGDRYPEALAIAASRFAEELRRLKERGDCPEQGTPEFRELERKFVPPYPVDIFIDKWRKLAPGQAAWTLPAHLAKDSYSHIHHDGDQARSISVREAARLQSFPDAFRFFGNMGDCFRQIGNAVPPLMSWAIAHTVLTQIGTASFRGSVSV